MAHRFFIVRSFRPGWLRLPKPALKTMHGWFKLPLFKAGRLV